MRQIRETLRLHLQAGLSYSEVGRALKISKSVVGKYITLARVAGVDCELAQTLSDEDLEARLYRPALSRSSHQRAPDFGLVHQELKRPGVTLMLLWEEYATANPLAYKYTSFCIKYGEFAKSQQRSMRQIHIAGDKLFVDYAGATVPIVDPVTGEITRAQIFVATLGASNYTYACATPRQTTCVMRRLARLCVALADSTKLNSSARPSMARSAPRALGTRAAYSTPGTRWMRRITSSASSSAGIAAGDTKDVTSILL